MLTLVGKQPLVVSGAHFHPRESVRVTVSSTGRESVLVRTDRTGAFRISLPDIAFGRCGGLQIRAVGTRGSVAFLKLPLPACMPASNP